MSRCLPRRRFLRQLATAALVAAPSAPFAQLALAAERAAMRKLAPTGHRALVCIYLAGGNDSFNLLVPRDGEGAGSRYSIYAQSRGGVFHPTSHPLGLALPHAQLVDGGVPAGSLHAFGLHPQAADYTATRNGQSYHHPGLATLFGPSIGRLGFVANVGPLVQPVSKAEFHAGAPVPAQLFSHSDQELLWHLGGADPLEPRGWAGRALDSLAITGAVSPCISVAGNARVQIGASVFPYQMSSSTGVTELQNFQGSYTHGDARRAALEDLLAETAGGVLASEYRAVLSRSRETASLLSAGLKSAAGAIATPYDYRGGSAPDPSAGFYPDANLRLGADDMANPLLDQLRMIARMIRLSRDAASDWAPARQVYYARLDGFDTHGEQMERHPVLIARLSQAVGWFWQALGEIGAQDDVTTVTLSDFGRTLSSNGDGSDHAWGGNQLVLGGQVLGHRVWGRYPDLVLDANNNATHDWSFSRGQYIPTTANEQLFAPLAAWLGVPAAEVDALFPNLAQFDGLLDIHA